MDHAGNAHDAFLRCFVRPDRRPIYEWAHDNLEMPACLPIKGKFDVHRSRHFIGPFDALADDHVRQVVILKPLRGGGTLISDIWHCWCRANDPGPAMVVLQNDNEAKQHCEERLMLMMTGCDPIKPLLPSDRHKQRTTEIMWADGIPFYVTGPSINNLQRKAIRYMSLDEMWLYKAGTINEAEGRLGDFVRTQTSKLCIVSQAGVENDDLDLRWQESSQSEWSVPCLSCGVVFAPRWTGERADGSKWGMKWDEVRDENGAWKIEACKRTVRVECPTCGHPHSNEAGTKSEWNRLGTYVETNPNASRAKKGFRWNNIIDYPWSELVEIYLRAANARKLGVIDPMVQFFQKRMAEPKSEASAIEGLVEFKKAGYDAKGAWEDEAHRFMTCDRQESGLYWVTIRAWATDGRSRRLYFGKVTGRGELEQLAREWQCINVFVDSGYESKGPQGVYAMCAANGWVALKGSDKKEFWHTLPRGRQRVRVQRSYSELQSADPETGTIAQGSSSCNLILFAADVVADRLDQLIHKGIWVEPKSEMGDLSEKEYRRQMSAEYKRKVQDPTTGKTKYQRVCPTRNNHAYDCAKMQVVAATLASLLPDYEDESFATANKVDDSQQLAAEPLPVEVG
jgi:Phage terminase large subunit (GpA)